MILKMEPLENGTSDEIFSSNFSSLGINSYMLSVNLSSTYPYISGSNTTLHQSEGNNTLYEVPTVAVVVLSLLYGAICLLAILGNLLVLCLVIVSLKL